MRSLVIGASGLVGGALLRALGDDAIGTYHRREVTGLRRLDACDREAVARTIAEVDPEVVFFPAAQANVDWCETHPDEAYAANVVPALSALDAAGAHGARFVYFSSEYVFDGAAGPYAEDDPVRPLNVYGRQKREVEERVLAADETLVRTTTVFGVELPPGKNFVLRLLASLRVGESVRVPNDQISTPTWADELARAAVAIALERGIWHVAGPDLLARDEFAHRVARAFALAESLIVPVPTSALRQTAARPLRAGLRTEKLARRLGAPLLSTDVALERLAAQLR